MSVEPPVNHGGPDTECCKAGIHWTTQIQSSWQIDSTAVACCNRKDSQSGLLVMGAYDRSRLRELVFGGMTERMLWHSNIPVIMQHT